MAGRIEGQVAIVTGDAPVAETPCDEERGARGREGSHQRQCDRAGEPEDVAHLALYLASPEADYVSGRSFTIDGGLELDWGQGA